MPMSDASAEQLLMVVNLQTILDLQGLGPLGLQLDASSLLMQLDRAQPNAVNFAQ